MSKSARSYFLASVFFSRRAYRRVRELGDFCRAIDEIATDKDSGQAWSEFQKIKHDLLVRESDQEWINRFLTLVDKDGTMTEAAYEYVVGAETDLHRRGIKDSNELIVYCYRRSGVLGLLVSSWVGVSGEEVQPYAVDLGIAMQLTEICIRISEDAERGRCYLPEALLRQHGTGSAGVIAKTIEPEKLRAVLDDFMAIAEMYYESGKSGVSFVSGRNRLSLIMALYFYRGLGRKAKVQSGTVLHKRVALTVMEKLMLGVWAFGFLVWAGLRRSKVHPHSEELHQAIAGFPGSNSNTMANVLG